MPEYIIRPFRPDDRPALAALWKTAFGDSDEYIRRFFRYFLRGDTCVVAEADGMPVSAMYILPGQLISPFRKNTLTAGYTYALATLPDYRGRGIGSAVYRAACAAALAGHDTACVVPAEEELFAFYQSAGAKPLSYMRQAVFSREELAGITPAMAARAPVMHYAGLRESLLSGYPHVSFPEEIYDFLEEDGYEFFVLDGGAALTYTDGGVCHVKELLYDRSDPMGAVAAVARWCRADTYVVRTPVFFDGPGTVRPFAFAVMNAAPAYPMPDDLWWGPGLD